MFSQFKIVFWVIVLEEAMVLPSRAAEAAQWTGAQERLSQHLAAVAANEGALRSPRDLELIWQTVQYRAKTVLKQDQWLRYHSGRVLGTRSCTTGNCLWSRRLGAGWSVPSVVAASQGGYWRHVVLPRYRELLERARRLVAGEPYDKPCRIEPRTWGGVGRDGVDDREHAAREGLFPIGCRGTLNDGFAPRKAFP
jgi:hypothetical protein